MNYVNNYAYAEEILEAEASSRFALNFKASDWDVRIPTSYEEVVEQVVLAQVASDGGKWLPRFKELNSLTEEAYQAGYEVKDDHILSAILGILSLGCRDSVNFFVSSDWDIYDDEEYGLTMPSIVYFEWENYQISFHSFNPVWKRVHDLFGTSTTEWDEGSSPYTCLTMIDFLVEQGRENWRNLENEVESLFYYANNEDDRLERVISVKSIDGVTARMYLPEMGVHHSYTMIELWGEENPYFVTD